jgi:hypothetical protein
MCYEFELFTDSEFVRNPREIQHCRSLYIAYDTKSPFFDFVNRLKLFKNPMIWKPTVFPSSGKEERNCRLLRRYSQSMDTVVESFYGAR